MVTDAQVRRLMKLIQSEQTLAVAAAKAGMDEKTARKWRDADQLPSQATGAHTWRTRADAFEDVWPGLKALLADNPHLEAKEPAVRTAGRAGSSPSPASGAVSAPAAWAGAWQTRPPDSPMRSYPGCRCGSGC